MHVRGEHHLRVHAWRKQASGDTATGLSPTSRAAQNLGMAQEDNLAPSARPLCPLGQPTADAAIATEGWRCPGQVKTRSINAKSSPAETLPATSLGQMTELVTDSFKQPLNRMVGKHFLHHVNFLGTKGGQLKIKSTLNEITEKKKIS